jgi:hypothetical protein
VYVFKKGQNAGKQCGKSKHEFCKTHESHVLQLLKLPELVINNMLNQIINFTPKEAFKTLVNLSISCQEFDNIITPFYKILYEKLKIPKKQDIYMNDLSYKYRLYLILYTGCQKCQTPRITKIYWPFPLRVCIDCLKSITISCNTLQHVYHIKNFTYTKYLKYNRHLPQSIDLRYYLIQDVKNTLKCELIEGHLNDHKRDLASKLNLSYSELFTKCKRFVYEEYPDIKTIEREYYRDLAIVTFDNYLKELKIDDYFSSALAEKRKLVRIKTKNDYDTWYDSLHDFEPNYTLYKKKERYMFIYNQKMNVLYNILCSTNITLEDVPYIHDLLEDYKDYKKDINELDGVFKTIENIVRQFIKVS